MDPLPFLFVSTADIESQHHNVAALLDEVSLLHKQVQFLERILFKPSQSPPSQRLAEIYHLDFGPDQHRLTTTILENSQ